MAGIHTQERDKPFRIQDYVRFEAACERGGKFALLT